MITPAGNDCKYFYGDYYRGRHREECRLLIDSRETQSWKPELCFTCPVPEILIANACEYMKLKGEIFRPFPYLQRRVKVTAYCNKCDCIVAEPKIGCGQCHPLPPIFSGELDGSDTPG